MRTSTHTLIPDKWTLDELRQLFEKKSFALPPMQRDFVWNKQKIIKLLDSIKKNYPIGSFLICKVPSNEIPRIKEDSIVLPLFDKNKNKDFAYLIIDGQQRLSVLYSVLFKHEIYTNRYKDPLDPEMIYLSSKKFREVEFEFYHEPPRGDYLKICDILNINTNIPKHKRNLANECKQAFNKYFFPYVMIKGYDEKRMKEAFDRLNRGGTKLSTYDTLMCLADSKDIEIRKHINNIREHKLPKNFKYLRKIEQHIFNSIAVNLGHSNFFGKSMESFSRKLANPYDKDKLHQKYKKYLPKIERSLSLAADYIKKKFAKDVLFLPYPSMLTILSTFYYSNNNKKPEPKQKEQIEKWFWITGFTKRYSGSNQRLNQINDVEEMKKLSTRRNYKINLEGKTSPSVLSITYLGKLLYNSGSATRNTFFCYLFSKEPRDLSDGEKINLTGDVSSLLNLKNKHHIYPRNLLGQWGYRRYEIDRLFNICLLDFSENLDIGDDPPWVYLRNYRSKKNFKRILKSHALPHHSCILSKGDVDDKYEQFLKKREELIRKDLTNLMGYKYVE